MVKIDFDTDKSIKKDIQTLYVKAFPRSERPTAHYFFESVSRNEENKLFGYYENNEFVGFTFLTFYKDVVYLFFLAVNEAKRNQGCGTKILEEVKESYKDKVILLCYEETNEKYKDNDLRLRREDFYRRNGFKNNGYKTDEFGVVFQTAYVGEHTVPFEDYIEIFVLGFGKWSKKFVTKC